MSTVSLKTPKTFPKDFLWGAATSSYQVEGGNEQADWYVWERKAGKQSSGRACGHYELYEQDFNIVQELHHNAHRLSIEWSRVEPREGVFDEHVIEHYGKVIDALRARGIEPIVTLHHFTSPQWLADKGGWADAKSVDYFLRFCKQVVPTLATKVHYWITINEPTIYISHSFMWGVWPPQLKSNYKAWLVRKHMVRAHIKTYKIMNKIYEGLNLKKPAISLAQHMQAIVACQPTYRNKLAVALRDKVCNFDILDVCLKAKTLDFIGINYYSRQRVDVSIWAIGNLLMETCSQDHEPMPKNSLGWDVYPQGLQLVLTKLHKRYHLPIMITENGMCTLNDEERWNFIEGHLAATHAAIEEGVNVIGYMYWSLMDNFEWDKGFTPRFGLLDVDYTTLKRIIRPSALKYAQVCKTSQLDNQGLIK